MPHCDMCYVEWVVEQYFIITVLLNIYCNMSVDVVLQHNCPVGNVDLQGRTALHDAGEITD